MVLRKATTAHTNTDAAVEKYDLDNPAMNLIDDEVAKAIEVKLQNATVEFELSKKLMIKSDKQLISYKELLDAVSRQGYIIHYVIKGNKLTIDLGW